MHKKRLITLTILVMTVLKNKKLSLTELGRAIELPIKERSGIRRVDRFLGNKKLYQDKEQINEILIKYVLGATKRPDIIVDWSSIPNTTHHTLRAALVATGRAITLYEEVHTEKKLGTKKVQNKFLQRLKKLLPNECKPIIITDAGFHNDWFKEVTHLGWDFIGRIRGKKYFRRPDEETWKLCSSLYSQASSTSKCLGEVELCRSNAVMMRFVLFKSKKKKRKHINKNGKKSRDKTSLDYSRSAKEPWLLATSLDGSYFLSKKVVTKYSFRMQIEEGFRDLKSSRYGFGFENAYSNNPARIEILLLIAMLAAFIAWITGFVAEKNGLHYQFQSNTVKNRRVLSLFFLGCQVIRRKINISIDILENAINEGLSYA